MQINPLKFLRCFWTGHRWTTSHKYRGYRTCTACGLRLRAVSAEPDGWEEPKPGHPIDLGLFRLRMYVCTDTPVQRKWWQFWKPRVWVRRVWRRVG